MRRSPPENRSEHTVTSRFSPLSSPPPLSTPAQPPTIHPFPPFSFHEIALFSFSFSSAGENGGVPQSLSLLLSLVFFLRWSNASLFHALQTSSFADTFHACRKRKVQGKMATPPTPSLVLAAYFSFFSPVGSGSLGRRLGRSGGVRLLTPTLIHLQRRWMRDRCLRTHSSLGSFAAC